MHLHLIALFVKFALFVKQCFQWLYVRHSWLAFLLATMLNVLDIARVELNGELVVAAEEQKPVASSMPSPRLREAAPGPTVVTPNPIHTGTSPEAPDGHFTAAGNPLYKPKPSDARTSVAVSVAAETAVQSPRAATPGRTPPGDTVIAVPHAERAGSVASVARPVASSRTPLRGRQSTTGQDH